MDAASGHAGWCPIIKYRVYGRYIMIIHDISILNGPFRPTFNWGTPSPVEVALWFDYSKYIFFVDCLKGRSKPETIVFLPPIVEVSGFDFP
jgi:hypothetical protein